MPKRQRWTPVKGADNRIYDPAERLLLSLLDGLGRLLVRPGKDAGNPPPDRVLVLRLDRIGDLVMSLPALGALRDALPRARISLAVGRWNEELARRAPVDEVLVWSAPWVGRGSEGAEGLGSILGKARALRAAPPDVAVDLQGDVRSNVLLALTGARVRVGYANTGGAYLLTRTVPLDETIPWVDQNLLAVRTAFPGVPLMARRVDLVRPEEKAGARALRERFGLVGRPLVAIHPSGGRRVKEWAPDRWAALGRRLQGSLGARIVLTGSRSDRAAVDAVREGLPGATDLSGQLSLSEVLVLLSDLDLFLSSDTGPMHLACALGTPSVSLFGPTDPLRYFSGDPRGPHRVVRHELWCSPCNLVRKPPAECRVHPECLRLVSEDAVFEAAAEILERAR
jgi:ADP-heptose:LPS heptosyltransferase